MSTLQLFAGLFSGSNLYCLDRNYGGVFILWDVIFDTYVTEAYEEDILFGLVISPESYNSVFLQVNLMGHFYNKLHSERIIYHKFKLLIVSR